ncbi:1-acyl-sn-glycerol-3-phosphate acyltransferase [Runella sp.]|jgi:1-acyl-sn-glycerol-3-phosphate acyltransferase|uniref:1-acyl-sn-glycerol-3-phosphate acyltransferase n=1 Tax=Runella sp. TaxID=1960881 RepID=UPI0026255952|nr:1-acyl-sn-glycerol-3-phosphate acyltransferase [Runella sp.]
MKQKSLFYNLLRSYVRFWHNVIFYRKVEIRNYPKDLPSNTPLLIVTNHQNTLMDALAVVLNVGARQPYFLTRADLFKKDFVRKLLMSLKMLPVYRLRDGMDEMQQNDEIFQTCVNILSNGGTLAAFPEGNHGVQYHLRPFKKGLARIAFKAETEHNWNVNLQILPCGLYYTHCQKMGERLILNFGEPFKVRDFRAEYEQNQPRTLTQITRRMSDDIKSLMLHFDDLPNHDTLKWLTDLELRKEGDTITNVRRKANELAQLRQQDITAYDRLMAETTAKREDLAQQGIEAEIYGQPQPSVSLLIINTLALLLTSPIAFYGWINSVIPYSIPFIFTKKLKDQQFSSAFRIVFFALITFPFIWLIQIGIVWGMTEAKTAALYALTLPFTGHFAHRWARWWSTTVQQWKLR